MLIESANRLNVRVIVLDSADSPAKQISSEHHIDGSFRDPDAIRQLARRTDLLTVEIEHVDVDVLEEIEGEGITQVNPSSATLRIIQDKFLQKEHLTKHGSPVVQSIRFENFEHAETRLGLPFMLKARKQAYDGRGNFVIKRKSDCLRASAYDEDQLYAERWMSFRCELAVMVIKSCYNRVDSKKCVRQEHCIPFPAVRTVHEDSVCKLVFAPAWDITAEVATRAQELAVAAVSTFTGKGVFGVEMFLMHNGKWSPSPDDYPTFCTEHDR